MALTTGAIKTESLTPIHWFVLGLVGITGVIHLYVGVTEGRVPVSLAGVGFFAGGGLFLLDYRRRALYVGGIVFTAIQIPLWYVANVGEFTVLGYADKVIQIALIVLLAYLYWRSE